MSLKEGCDCLLGYTEGFEEYRFIRKREYFRWSDYMRSLDEYFKHCPDCGTNNEALFGPFITQEEFEENVKELAVTLTQRPWPVDE